MNFFTLAGSFLKQGVSNVRSFIFPKSPAPKATQAVITQPAATTTIKSQSQASTNSFFGRISGVFRSAKEKATQTYDRLSVGVKKLFLPKEIKTIGGQLKTSVTDVAVTGIKTLASTLKNKISGGMGQSGTLVDRRPFVEDRSPAVIKGSGESNFLGGFEFPFLGSLVGNASAAPIPYVPDTDGFPTQASQGTVTQSGGSSNLMLLVIIGAVAFFIIKGRK